jgi:hypothetical protein
MCFRPLHEHLYISFDIIDLFENDEALSFAKQAQ